MKKLALEFWTQFVTPSGEVRELVDPEGPATVRQLRRLNAVGALVIVEPGTAKPIVKGEACYAVSVAGEMEPVHGEAPNRWKFSS
jgi:hypothetical protein